MDIQKEIMSAIDSLIKERMPNISSDVLAMVLEIKDNKYRVVLGGADRWVINGIGVEIAVCDRVWVRIPNGNISQAFIEAKI